MLSIDITSYARDKKELFILIRDMCLTQHLALHTGQLDKNSKSIMLKAGRAHSGAAKTKTDRNQ